MKREKRALRAIHPENSFGKEILGELEMTQGKLADLLGVSRRAVNELVGERRGISPDMALRLGRLFRSNPEFWLRLQVRWDLARAQKASAYKTVRPLPKSKTLTV